MVGDMCVNHAHCGDVALPGRDYCDGCWQDEVRGREITRQIAARLTAEHEAKVIEEEELV